MWAFNSGGYNAFETTSRPTKTFDVEDFLGSLFRPQDAFVHAASLNQLEVVQRWIVKHHDVNLLDKEGHSALCVAAQNRCMDVLMMLLENGVHVNEQQSDGKTALHVACIWGRFDAATLLLEHGACSTLRDKDGQVPLHGACKNGHDRIVQLLLNTNVDPFIADELGATPFDLARDWQRLEILRILDEYHRTRFTPMMRSRVQFVMKNLDPHIPALPSDLMAENAFNSYCCAVHSERSRFLAMAAAPPPSPMSPTGMDSLGRVDLSTLRSDTVLVYADRVIQLNAARINSPEKLQMLFMLSQKLLRWFLEDRRESERLRTTLQETLLETLEAKSSQAIATETQADAESCHNSEASDDNVITVETLDRGVQVVAVVVDACFQTEVNDFKTLDSSVQTDFPPIPESSDASEHTGTEVPIVAAAVDPTRRASSCTVETQTVISVNGCVDSTIQAEALTCERDSQTQVIPTQISSAETQTEDPVATIVESNMQIEAVTAEGSVQTDTPQTYSSPVKTETDPVAASTDCSVQIEGTTVEVSVQTEANHTRSETIETQTVTREKVECGVQVVPSAVDNFAQVGISTTDNGMEVEILTEDCEAQTTLSDCDMTLNTSATQTITQESMEYGVQVVPSAADHSTQAETSTTDNSMQVEVMTTEVDAQTNPSAEVIDSCTQDTITTVEVVTQTESSADAVDYGVQVEVKTPSSENSVQTEVDQSDCFVQTELECDDCAVQVQSELATTSVQTRTLEVIESETQTTHEMTDHDTSTHGHFESIDFAVQADEADWIEVIVPSPPVPPIDVYFQVHRSIIRLQRVVRGHMTRRRFFRMLNELVNAK